MRFSRRIALTVSWLWKMKIKLQIHHFRPLKAYKIKNKTKKRQPLDTKPSLKAGIQRHGYNQTFQTQDIVMRPK